MSLICDTHQTPPPAHGPEAKTHYGRKSSMLTTECSEPGETGTIISDFQLSGEAFEDDLDPMAVVEIEPRCHPLVLHDAALDQSWSPEASTVRAKVDAGRKPRFERGGDGKAYGRRYIANQFKSLDMSIERMKLAKVCCTTSSSKPSSFQTSWPQPPLCP